MRTFLARFRNADGGLIRTDQGGELARSEAFRNAMKLDDFKVYVVESTGADSPNQNAKVEKWNDTLGTTVRTLLYSSGLPAKYWSAALLHAAYLHNRRVHRSTKRTPFQSWYGVKPNFCHLKRFGSRVYV